MTGERVAIGPAEALRDHWPEYLIEGWALGMFMISAGVFSTLLGYQGSPLLPYVPDDGLRRALVGIAMGLTAVGLIYSPWGRRSGAHMNPAVTLTFLRLGRIGGWDAVFYMLAQFIGGAAGVVLTAAVLRDGFTTAPVRYILTLPGAPGVLVAFLAEFGISMLLMAVILTISGQQRLSKFTGICAGVLVATYITVEAPLSGMSMNPARSFASAAPAGVWDSLWIYFTAPVLGMQAAAAWHAWRQDPGEGCAKLHHADDQRCIHCGYDPERAGRDPTTATGALS